MRGLNNFALIKYLNFRYSKICYATSLKGSHIVTGIQASVQCALKAQGARLATFLSLSELQAFTSLDGFSSVDADGYWLGKPINIQP